MRTVMTAAVAVTVAMILGGFLAAAWERQIDPLWGRSVALGIALCGITVGCVGVWVGAVLLAWTAPWWSK